MRIARYYTGKKSGLWLVHTRTAVFFEHLVNTSFMASIQAQTELPSGLPLHVYFFMLSRLIRYLAVWVSHLPLHCYLDGFSLMYKQTTQQRYTTHMDTHIHITSALLFFFSSFLLSLYTSSTFLGRPVGPDPSVLIQVQSINYIHQGWRQGSHDSH